MTRLHTTALLFQSVAFPPRLDRTEPQISTGVATATDAHCIGDGSLNDVINFPDRDKITYSTGEQRGCSMGYRDGSSRRRLLRTLAASGTVFVGGCSVVLTEGEPTEGGGTRTSETVAIGQQREPQETLPSEDDTVGLRRVTGGLTAPVQFREPAGGGGRQFVADQTGVVHVLTAGGLRDEPFLDVRDALVDLGENLPEWAVNEERGLLGLEFHPDYDENGKCYVRYSTPAQNETSESISHTEVLSEFRAGPDFRSAARDSERVLLEIPKSRPIHQGGAISFGPDGYLYVTMGDDGIPSTPQDAPANAQDTTSLFGSVLRIDVDDAGRDRPYSIPDDNPLVGSEGRDELFAWGFRNPWRLSFDGSDLYVADVGSSLYEEVNLVRSGGNYGWPVKEGPRCIELEDAIGEPTECPDETAAGVGVDSLLDPEIGYPHSRGGEVVGFAVIGGHVYREESVPSLSGKYVFGDYSSSYEQPSGTLFAAEPADGDGWELTELTVANAEDERLARSILSIGRGQDGELYVLTSERPPSKAADFTGQPGELYQIVPPGQVETTVG